MSQTTQVSNDQPTTELRAQEAGYVGQPDHAFPMLDCHPDECPRHMIFMRASSR